MISIHAKFGILILLLLVHGQCGTLERDNPLDPGGESRQTASTAGQSAADRSALSLRLPLPKALLGVVDSVVAILEGPDIQPVVKRLSISPLGPATGILGALQPGNGRTLTIEGFDLEGNLIFTGQQTDITIAVGDTTSVQIALRLTQPLPPDGGEPADGGDPGDATPDDSGVEDGTDGSAEPGDAPGGDIDTGQETGPEGDSADQGDVGAGDTSGEDSSTDQETGTEDDTADQEDTGEADSGAEAGAG